LPFSPASYDCFRITSFEADPAGPGAVLRYALDDEHVFEERIAFGGRGVELSPGARAGFEAVVRLLHLAAGVSYYKTAAPRRIVVETGALSPAESRFLHGIYDSGMREFAYRNGLAVPLDLDVSTAGAGDRPHGTPAIEAPPPGTAVPVGGGKDSIVVLEALKHLDPPPVLVSINSSPAVERIASISGLGLFAIERRIDPLLLELNRQGAMNGHVPVTAIVCLLAVAGGYVRGYDTTVMATEASADAPTRVDSPSRVGGGPPRSDSMAGPAGGVEINHQWSKSAEFETLLGEALRDSVHSSVRCVSVLRRFTELEITGAFATLTPYLSSFRSCNRAFRISDPFDGWCADCPKCRFVFLALAPFLGRRELVQIFGTDMLDDVTQVEGFSDMLDPRRKPFECVGTVEEVFEAFGRLLADPSWSGAVVVEHVRKRIGERGPAVAGPARHLASSAEVFAGIRDCISESVPRARSGAAPTR